MSFFFWTPKWKPVFTLPLRIKPPLFTLTKPCSCCSVTSQHNKDPVVTEDRDRGWGDDGVWMGEVELGPGGWGGWYQPQQLHPPPSQAGEEQQWIDQKLWTQQFEDGWRNIETPTQVFFISRESCNFSSLHNRKILTRSKLQLLLPLVSMTAASTADRCSAER